MAPGRWLVAFAAALVANYGLGFGLATTVGKLGPAESARPDELTVVLETRSPDRFVEANPSVPENEPDPTPNFGARDQQAAQPDPVEEEQGFPARESEMESQTIVPRAQPGDPVPAGVYAVDPRASEESPGQPSPRAAEEAGGGAASAAPVERTVDPGFEEPLPEEEGLRERETPPGQVDEGVREASRTIHLSPGQRDGETRRGNEATSPRNARPMPRPTLGEDVLLAPLNREERGSSSRGTLAVNSRLTDFGDYLQRAMEAIQSEWHRLNREVELGVSNAYARVTLRIVLNPDGGIERVETVETTAGALGTAICEDAVYARAPYGIWTDEMRRILGESTELEITFHYR